MDNSLITIIIPVYNAQKYIAKCAESLINQTHKNIEVIFVDDCSTDSSCKVIQRFVKKDSRVKLYSTGTNGGPGKARNVGLENAHGEYIMFCDNDDSYKPNMCEVMLKAMIEHNVDLVTCKPNVIHGKLDRAQEHYAYSDPTGYYDFGKHRRFGMTVFVWNKLYKKSLLDKYNIKFTTLVAEDDLFTFTYNSVTNSYYGLKDKLYNFVLRKASYTLSIAKKGKNPKIKWDKLKLIKEYMDFLGRNDLLEERFRLLKIFIRNEFWYIFRYYGLSLFELIKFLREYHSYTDPLNNKELGFYNIYLKFRTPWFFFKILKMCYWS